MKQTKRYADYDGFAKIYNSHWGPSYGAKAIPLLKKLLLDGIPKSAKILDLCCGSGHITRELLDEGYAVTGIDGSGNLLEYAKQNAPGVRFILADVRHFQLDDMFDAVVSLNDSLNHIMSLEELIDVFRNVKSSLNLGGWFLFDLNLAYKYETSWTGSFAVVEDDIVCAVRANTHMTKRVAEFAATIFEPENTVWIRKDITLYQTWYQVTNIVKSLEDGGFYDIVVLNKNAKILLDDFQTDKAYFKCRKG